MTFFLLYFFFYCYCDHRDLHSFPTRRSSDLFLVPFLRCHTCSAAFRSSVRRVLPSCQCGPNSCHIHVRCRACDHSLRSEEHTSELQSRRDLVCRLLLEKKKNNNYKQLY